MNINQAPKNISEMKIIINPAAVRDLTLAERMNALVGFRIAWGKLNLVQSAMVWLAWLALSGDADAAVVLNALKANNSIALANDETQ